MSRLHDLLSVLIALMILAALASLGGCLLDRPAPAATAPYGDAP